MTKYTKTSQTTIEQSFNKIVLFLFCFVFKIVFFFFFEDKLFLR